MIHKKKFQNNLLVGVLATTIYLGKNHLLGLPNHFLTASFLFLLFALAYTFQRNIQHFDQIQDYLLKNKHMTVLILLCALNGTVVVQHLSDAIVLVSCLALGFFYSVNVSRGASNLRSLPYLKNAWVGITWVLMCIVFETDITKDLLEKITTLSAGFYFYIQAAIVPLDLKDREVEFPKLKTIAGKIDGKYARIYGLSCQVLAGICLTSLSNSLAKSPLFYLANSLLLLCLLFLRSQHKKGYFEYVDLALIGIGIACMLV